MPSGALACPHCHALVHADQLSQVVSEAKSFEARGAFGEARDKWRDGLALVPPVSTQAAWIRTHLAELEQADAAGRTPQPSHSWARRLGPLAPLAVLLAKGKSLLVLLKLNFLVSLVAFIGFYWALYGARFGIGFALLILWHEMGHYLEVKRRGLPADMPVFLPGFGAYVRWQAMGVSLEARATVSLAGPFAGLIAAVGCLALWGATGSMLWAALARAGAWLNAINLVPVWVLDGGQAALALDKKERVIVLSAAVLLWLVSGDGVFFLVALGAAWRAFAKDAPLEPSRAATIGYVALLAGLAAVMWMTPQAQPLPAN